MPTPPRPITLLIGAACILACVGCSEAATPADGSTQASVVPLAPTIPPVPDAGNTLAFTGTPNGRQVMAPKMSVNPFNGQGDGQVFSWDGRLHFSDDQLPGPPVDVVSPTGVVSAYTTHQSVWRVKAFRPQNALVSDAGFPDPSHLFGSANPVFTRRTSTDSQVMGRSNGALLFDSLPPELASWQCKGSADPTTLFTGDGVIYHTLAVVPLDHNNPGPFRSDSNGVLQAKGTYLTYKFYIFADDRLTAYDSRYNDSSQLRTSGYPETSQPRCDTAETSRMYRVQGQVVLDPIRGSIVSAQLVQPAPVYLVDTAGNALLAIEPTINIEGNFLVVDGYDTVLKESGALRFSYNTNGTNGTTGWSPFMPINRLYAVLGPSSGVSLNGVPASDVVPLARQPFYDALGRIYDPNRVDQCDGGSCSSHVNISGAYPWMNLDASELFFEGAPVCQGGKCGNLLRAGTSVIGRWTGYMQRHIDGWLNPDLGDESNGAVQRTIIVSSGAHPSAWDGTNQPGSLLPVFESRAVYPIFGSNLIYDEVDFTGFVDGRYVLHLPMNEVIVPDRAVNNRAVPSFDSTRTPDLSALPDPKDGALKANYQVGVLDGGASIPSLIPDVVTGVVPVSGKYAQFPEGGSVVVADHPALDASTFQFGLTLEAFIRPTPAFSGNLLSKNGLFSIGILASQGGGFTASTTINCAVGPAVSMSWPVAYSNQFQHLAVVWDALGRRAHAYMNAQLVATSAWTCSSLPASTGSALVVGPNHAGGTATPVLYVDEVKIASYPLSSATIAREAQFLALPQAQEADLPLGLSAPGTHFPASKTYDQRKALLGQRVFYDPHFSADGQYACVSCHNPSVLFKDTRSVSEGVQGTPLPRQAPDILNRLYGLDQAWDGSRDSVERQVLTPLLGPAELGLTVSSLLTIASAAKYGTAQAPLDFHTVYGPTPVSVDEVEDAVGQYVRTLVTGNSRYDRAVAGSLVLSSEEELGRQLFFGKARCFSCHAGPNFTDELPHREGFTPLEASGDTGLIATTSRSSDLYLFKTPSLRNVDQNGPYFHNGSFADLCRVIDQYNKGPNAGHDHMARPLGLSTAEEQALLAFLQTLSSTEYREVGVANTLPVKKVNNCTFPVPP